MVDQNILKVLREYLSGAIPLVELSSFISAYDWDNLPAVPTFEQYLVGLIELYISEISEAMEDEESLRKMLISLFSALDPHSLHSSEFSISEFPIRIATVISCHSFSDAQNTESEPWVEPDKKILLPPFRDAGSKPVVVSLVR